MNRQNVDKVEFWKERIEKAQQEHFSVYVTTEPAWIKIAEIHKKICDQEIGGKVLDAGCGYGRASEWFKDYTGVDFSPDFIEKSRSKYPNKKFVLASLKSLPFQDKEFDWVVCVSIRAMIRNYQGHEHWEEMEKELRRVGKKILILEYTEPERYEII